jgi:hypothetical protein
MPCMWPGSTPNPKSGSEIAIDTRRGPVEGAYQNTPGAPCTACRCTGILFELLNGTEELACNFYYSAVGLPDHQAGTGVPPRNPGLRPNFQVQHLLCPACGLALPCHRYSSRGVHGSTGERETPATMDQMALASPPATTDQVATATGTTSKTPTTAETKEKATTKAAEHAGHCNSHGSCKLQAHYRRHAVQHPQPRRGLSTPPPPPLSPPPQHTIESA